MLFVVETVKNIWIVRAKDIEAALNKVDPDGYIRRAYNVSIKKLTISGNAEILGMYDK